ncbi:MAG: hypothetical protein EP311_10130 [Cytophagales bacterium]|nr:MAG: hypothetical protein EP311_10130 [Cytophagales bacterium]
MKSLLRIFLLLFFVSCAEEGDMDSPFLGVSYEVRFDQVRFQVNEKLYQQLNFERGSNNFCANLGEIRAVKRTGNELQLVVRRNSSCNGDYLLVWDGGVQESMPERVQLYLFPQFTNCGSTSGNTVNDTLKIDLKRAFMPLQESVVNRMSIYIRENCNFFDFNCEGDCDLEKD